MEEDEAVSVSESDRSNYNAIEGKETDSVASADDRKTNNDSVENITESNVSAEEPCTSDVINETQTENSVNADHRSSNIVIEEKPIEFGDNFELFDELSPTDEIWNTKVFRKKLKTLGPDILQHKSLAAKVCPFQLEWIYGVNRRTPIVNLSVHRRKFEIFYPGSHVGIVYDHQNQRVTFLQGHQNRLISISATFDGHWLVTADSGPDNIIMVWNRDDYSPAVILFDPYKGGRILCVGISFFGKYLLSIGEVGETDELEIDIWLWADGKDVPNGSVIPKSGYGKPVCIKFNPDYEEYFMVVFEKAVMFLTWDDDEMNFKDPVVPTMKSKYKIGTLIDATYVEESHECYVCSSEGVIAVFGTTLYYKGYTAGPLDNEKIFIKVCKIASVPVTAIASADGILATGDSKGRLLFYDKRLRIIYWLDKFLGHQIDCIGFNLRPRQYLLSRMCLSEPIKILIGAYECDKDEDKTEEIEIIYRDHLIQDASPIKERSVIRDFIILHDASICFVEYVQNEYTYIVQSAPDYIAAIDTHEEFAYILVGYSRGILNLLNYSTNEVLIHWSFPSMGIQNELEEEPNRITCIKYSPRSLHLACGMSNGSLWLLEPILLRPKYEEPLRLSRHPIDKIAFSFDNLQLGFCNTMMSTYLCNYNRELNRWTFMGKVRAHYKTISDIFFFPMPPATLVTVGTDRHIAQYNNVDIRDGVEFTVMKKERIEQSAVPLSCIPYPAKHKESSFRYILISDDQHKYKLVNESTLMCRYTALGPAYGCYISSPVQKTKILPNSDDEHMVYMTKKHVGLQKLPLSGNPYSFIGCFAHSDEIIDFAVSADGEYVFTIGINDSTILKWRTKTKGLELMHNLGGVDFEPYYCIIEGGKNGFLFQEMQDLFFYMQILHEGENSTLPRRVSDRVNVAELPDLMRACGFYPTDYEIETLMVDIKYRDYDVTDTLHDEISFLEFAKLYVNHKPVHGYSLPNLESVFKTFSQSVEEPTPNLIKRDDFLELVTTTGESISITQIRKCMEILLGESTVDEEGNYTFEFIPEDITYSTLRDDIFGIDMERKMAEVEVADDNDTSENSTEC